MAEPPRPLEGWSGPATVGGPRRRGDHDEGAGARCDSPVSPLPPPVFLYPGARQRPQQAASGSSPELGGGRTVVAGDGDSPLSPSSNLPLLMMMMNYPGVPGSGDRGALSKKCEYRRGRVRGGGGTLCGCSRAVLWTCISPLN
ncbi:hypothetical protein NDU88_000304 [Pleurodeles waltl]|uniref:Uncharacterized protein n=1 Tax=Pleurodeles waltl TaxID=8319 RepID=A0AAV7VWZ6_PLEWA|nr:hypothetical protein NDU88_000304 [Pleurodeles waltl]